MKRNVSGEFNTISYYDKVKEERKGTPNARQKETHGVGLPRVERVLC